MKKFFKTLSGCFLSIIVLITAQLIGIGAGEILTAVGLPAFIGGTAASVLYPVLTYFGLKFIFQKIYKIQLSEIGIKKFSLKPVWCITAVLLPLSVVTAFLFMDGEWSVLTGDDKISVVVTGIGLYSIAGGIVEEMVFRGIIMGFIRKNYNIKSAVIIPSILFGLMHIIGNKLSFISILQLIAAGTTVGIMFSLIMYQSDNFWNNALVHALWNMSTVGLLHVGTEPDNSAVYTYVLRTDNIFITGGDFGIESSVISIIGYVLVIAVTVLIIRKDKTGGNHDLQQNEKIIG